MRCRFFTDSKININLLPLLSCLYVFTRVQSLPSSLSTFSLLFCKWLLMLADFTSYSVAKDMQMGPHWSLIWALDGHRSHADASCLLTHLGCGRAPQPPLQPDGTWCLCPLWRVKAALYFVQGCVLLGGGMLSL